MSDKLTVGGEKSQSGSDGTIGLIEWNLNERLSCRCRCVWRMWSGCRFGAVVDERCDCKWRSAVAGEWR